MASSSTKRTMGRWTLGEKDHLSSTTRGVNPNSDLVCDRFERVFWLGRFELSFKW